MYHRRGFINHTFPSYMVVEQYPINDLALLLGTWPSIISNNHTVREVPLSTDPTEVLLQETDDGDSTFVTYVNKEGEILGGQLFKNRSMDDMMMMLSEGQKWWFEDEYHYIAVATLYTGDNEETAILWCYDQDDTLLETFTFISEDATANVYNILKKQYDVRERVLVPLPMTPNFGEEVLVSSMEMTYNYTKMAPDDGTAIPKIIDENLVEKL